MSGEGNIDACPVTRETWEARAAIKQADCGGQSVYHCLSDSVGRKWERCVEKTKIIGGQCPIFTADGYIDWKPCNTTIPTCPNTSYVSNEVYRYPECFGDNIPREKVSDGPNKGIIIGVVVAVLVIIAIAALIIVIMYRRRRSHTDSRETEEQQPLVTVMTEDMRVVETAMSTLSRVKCVVILGRFGSSVSSTSLRILKAYVEQNEDWKTIQCRYTEIPEVIDQNTIMFVYGWFGIWNEDPCSVNNVIKACKTLMAILDRVSHVKIIIGMRSDLSKKYHQILEQETKGLFEKEISLDTENEFRDKEYKDYFYENIKKPCQRNECACQDLKFDMLRKGSDIGVPLKMNILAKFHEVIPALVINGDLMEAFVRHITALNNDKTRSVYQWIMYICLKGKFDRSVGSDEDLRKKMGFEIKDSSFDEMYMNELQRYLKPRNTDQQDEVPLESAQFVFWHPFIYICAFHSLYEKDPEAVLRYCNIDAIVQLVRPKEAKKSSLEVSAETQQIFVILERMQQLGIVEDYIQHPLVTVLAAAEMKKIMMSPLMETCMHLVRGLLEPLNNA